MSNKNILILGASELQLPGIKKAQEMGLNCIAVDYDSHAAGAEEADIFYNISTMDLEGVLQVAKKHNVKGIFTICSDRPMRIVAKVGNALGLNTISEKSALLATNKAYMRNSFAKNNVPIPQYRICFSEEECMKAVCDIGFPAIIKPSDNAGSRGISYIDNKSNIAEAYVYAKENSMEGVVLVEEFLHGTEVSVEAFVENGNISIIQVTDKITTGAPHFVEMGHDQPSAHNAKTIQEISDITKCAIKSLEIEGGPIHAELKITENGVKVIELGARLGGDHISTDLVMLSTGIDMVEANIKWAIGEPFDIKQKYRRYSAIRYVGKLNFVKMDKQCLNIIDYFSWNRLYVDEIKSSRDRECCFIVSDVNKESLKNKISKIDNALGRNDKLFYW